MTTQHIHANPVYIYHTSCPWSKFQTLGLWKSQCSYQFYVLTSTLSLPTTSSVSPTFWKAYPIFLSAQPAMTLSSHFTQKSLSPDFISTNDGIIFPTRNWTHSCSMSLSIFNQLSIFANLSFLLSMALILSILTLMSLFQDLSSHLN